MAFTSRSYELFDSLFEATKDKLYAFVLKHTRDPHDTEDILQHCYMKLWENLETVDAARIDNLMFTYARNTIIDRVRKKRSAIVVTRETEGTAAAESTSAAEREEELAHLNKQAEFLLAMLPPKRKQVFTLVRIEGMSYDEVSDQLGISKLTIKQHMHEALRFLREHTAMPIARNPHPE